MKNHEASSLRRRGNQKVRDLAASLSPRREKALNLPGSVKMVGSRFHEFERLECLHQVIPLCGVPCRVSDLKVAYGGSSEFASFQARLDGASNFGSFETRENARVHQVRQRHASSRSTRSARARTSRDFFTAARRFCAARRRASFTVSLMVWVPSSARAASNACSSMSTRRFVMWPVYIRARWIYLTTGGGSKDPAQASGDHVPGSLNPPPEVYGGSAYGGGASLALLKPHHLYQQACTNSLNLLREL